MKLSKKKLLSIIIPVYNTELYLEECVRSLLTNNISLEIIIIDDGSTDSSLKVARKLKKEIGNIIILEQINHGQGYARNRGLELASGKYVYFMDSDDLVEENMFDFLIPVLENENLLGIFFDATTFLDEGFINDTQFNPSYKRNKSYGFYKHGEDLLVDMIRNKEYSVSPCLYIINREFILENNIKFPEGTINEDDSFTTELLLKIYNITHYNEIFFKRRVRKGSTMTSSDSNSALKGQYVSFNNYNYFLENHTFLSKNNKKTFKNIIINKLIIIDNLIEITKDKSIKGEIIQKAKKHHYYNFKGLLLLKYPVIYNFFKKIKLSLDQR